MGGKCASSLPVTPHLPLFISIFLTVASFVIIAVCYWWSERKLRKNFYGVIDELDEEEKQLQDAEAIGQYDGEIKIVQSMENIHARSIAPSSTSQVKVLMKRRRATPKPHGSFSREGALLTTPVTTCIPRSPIDEEFRFHIECNRQMLAQELINPLKDRICEEVYRARHMYPNQKELLPEDEIRIGEAAVSEMKAKLESLTNNKPWICHGRLMNNTKWVVDGHENLFKNPTDLFLSVRIVINQPLNIVLIGYSMQNPRVSSRSNSNAMAAETHATLPLASTPLMTDPMTPLKNSKGSQLSSSALKKMTTAEPLLQAPRTPVKAAMLPPAPPPVDAPTTAGIGPPKKTSESKMRTPTKVPRTPKRSPPATTPTVLPSKGTPQGLTPVVTGVSNTHVATTAAATTQATTPIPKTPQRNQRKKTKSDDTQGSENPLTKQDK